VDAASLPRSGRLTVEPLLGKLGQCPIGPAFDLATPGCLGGSHLPLMSGETGLARSRR
jgi:hypothetical protein